MRATSAPLALAVLAALVPAFADEDPAAALSLDDECAAGDSDCTFSARQLKAELMANQIASSTAQTVDSLEAELATDARVASTAETLDILEAGAASYGLPGEAGQGAPGDGGDSDKVAIIMKDVLSGEDAVVHQDAGLNLCGMRYYKGPPFGAEACFCQKAHNPACVRKECACREGCKGYLIQSMDSISFVNNARSTCRRAMLTVPRSFYQDIGDLKRSCGGTAMSVLSQMLSDGWRAYQRVAPSKAVMQCIHDPAHVSVRWLHLHTFCVGGVVDRMPNRYTSYCSEMTSIAQAPLIASKFLKLSR